MKQYHLRVAFFLILIMFLLVLFLAVKYFPTVTKKSKVVHRIQQRDHLNSDKCYAEYIIFIGWQNIFYS